MIPVNLNYGEEKEYYFHLQSGTSIIVNLHLWEKNSYIVQASVENFLYGIFLGIMAVMAFYNLFIFLSTGESAYLYYILYIICFTIMQEAKNGFMYVTFLQAYPVISNNIVPLFIPLAVVFSAFFAKKFLKTDTNFTGSETALNILTGGAVLSGTVNFFIPPNFALLSALAAAGFWSIVMFGVSLNALLKKYKPARIFFTAWLFLIAAVFISALNVAGVLNDNFFTLHCMEIGSALEVILLSLALADRINFLKKENELAQKEVLNKQITLSKSFARFVPFEMLEFLNRKIITEVELGDAVEKEMTVLFTDIRNYTSISEKFSPDENFRFLNFVLKDLGPIIRNHSGVIDKFIGDAIMALFSGSPDNAVQAAVQMKRQLKILNRNLVQMNFPPIDIGIGINTGKLILGTVGDEERMEATVISDTVNLASRIEGLTKHYHTEILLGEDSIRNLSETENYAFRLIDRVLVKGKKKPINLFEVIDFSDAEKSKCLQYKDQMEKTIRLFRERKFEKAKSEFQKMHRMNSEDRILVIYLERCRRYIKKPPASDWDGTNEMEFK